MVSSRDSRIIELWLQRQARSHTRGCYRLDAARLLAHAARPLSRLTWGISRALRNRWFRAAWLRPRAFAR
jgi:hypothetical protein